MRCLQIISLLLAFIFSLSAHAQSDSLKTALQKLTGGSTQRVDSAIINDNPQLNAPGKVDILSDSAIVQLERNTRGFKEVKGYRIQIMLGSIENIKAERNKFLSLGLPYSAYLKQIVPEYSLQVGDFTSRLEVEKHLQIIREHYPRAFVVVDVIEPQKF